MEPESTKIYIASIDGLSYEKLYHAAGSARKAKADKLRFTEDKLRCLAAEALLRHAINEQGIRDYSIMTDEKGKPYLEGLPVHFNLSHSGNFVLCALSTAPVGCDIQETKNADLRLVRRYFAPEEIKQLESTPPEHQTALFCRLWVLKESLGKALGCGLNETVLRREFDLSGADPVLKGSPELFFREFSIPGHRCAVCSQCSDISSLAVVYL